MSKPKTKTLQDEGRIDHLVQKLAAQEAVESGESSGTSPEADSTVKEMKAELDTLAERLQQQVPVDPYQDESAFRRGLSLVEAIGRDLSFTGHMEMESQPDESLGMLREYQLISKLGQGGMGTVYKALHTKLDKIVALKVLPTDKFQDEHAIVRFEREMKAVGKLEHPNIVRATDAGEIDGKHFLVMEQIDGLDLSTIVRTTGPLNIADACEIVRQSALGLQHACDHGLVHRDIKPSNLMLQRVQGLESSVQSRKQSAAASPSASAATSTASGSRPSTLDSRPSVKILDMGLALLEEHRLAEQRDLTTTGQMMGTLDYMAPEQGVDSHEVDIRADIYSLGATLFKLLCGEAPFSGKNYKTPMQVLLAIASEPAPSVAERRDDVPAELADIVDRMLQKNPDDRFATPREVAEALQPFVADCDLADLLERAEQGLERDARKQPLTGTNEYLSAPSTETKENFREPVRARSDQTDRFEKTQLAKTVPSASASYRRPAFIASVALGVMGLVMAAVIIHIMTDKGELIIRSEADDVQVTVKRHSGEPVEDIELVKGEGQTTLRSGKYEVVISGDNADQFQITPNIVTLSRNGRKVVTIERKDNGGERSKAMPRGLARVPGTDASPAKPVDITPAPLREIDAGEPLGPTALVAKPAKIAELRSWTIETRGHREDVRNVVSYDEDSLITRGLDGTVRMWDTKTRQLQRLVFTDAFVYHEAARLPNGRFLITGRDAAHSGPISVWDAKSLRLLRRHEAPPFPYWALQLSPDERSFACRSIDGMRIVVRSSDTGEISHQFAGDGPGNFQYSPDGKWLASGGSGVTVKLHSLTTSEPDRELIDTETQPGVPSNVTWSTDGQFIAKYLSTYYGKPYRIAVWSATTGELIYRSDELFKAGVDILWKNGTHHLLACDQEHAQLIDIDTGKVVWMLDVHVGPSRWIRPSPDDSQFTLGDKLVDLGTGKLLRTFSGPQERWGGKTWSPDGHLVAAPANGGTVGFWRPTSSNHLLQIQGVAAPYRGFWSSNGPSSDGIISSAPYYAARSVVWSNDGRRVVANAENLLRSIHFDDARSQGERTVELAKGNWQGLACSPTGDRVVAADDAGGIKVWEVATKQIVYTLRDKGNQVYQSMWSGDGKTIVVSDKSSIAAWNAQTGEPIFSTPVRSSGGFAINRTGDKIANVESNSIAIRSLDDGMILDRVDVPSPDTLQRSIAWLDDNRTIVVSFQDGILRFIDTESMNTVRVIEGAPAGGGFSDDGSIYSWELTEHSARTLETASGRTETITWLRDENWLIVTDDGHYRGSPQVDRMLVYVVETDDGTHHIMTPDEFAAKYDWQNDPEQVQVLR